MDSKNKTKLTSSEELCAEFDDLVEDETNTIEKEDKIVICTLDFEKYYPSMNIDDCAEIVEQEWLKSDLLILIKIVFVSLVHAKGDRHMARVGLSLTIKGCVRLCVCVTPFCVITQLSHWLSELNI